MRIDNLRKQRVVFTMTGCHHCAVAKRVIPKINMNLPFEKQIHIVDCSEYRKWGIKNDLISMFEKYIDGFPILFIDGHVVKGANTESEYEAFLNVYLRKELISPPNFYMDYRGGDLPMLFDKNCKYEKGFLGWKVVCE